MIKVESAKDGVEVQIAGKGREIVSELFALVNGLMGAEGLMKEITDRALEAIASLILDQRIDEDKKREVLHVMQCATATGIEEAADEIRKYLKENVKEREELWN